MYWDRITPAIGYIIDANGVELQTKNNYIDVSDYVNKALKLNRFTITAEGGKTKGNSDESVFEYETEFISKGLEYIKVSNGYSVAEGEADITKKIVMPDKVNGEPIIEISDDAFMVDPDNVNFENFVYFENSDIPAVRLPIYTERIGVNAFLCSHLQVIKFPKKLKEIGMSAFAYCFTLKEIYFPKSIEIIDMFAFDCSLYFTDDPYLHDNPLSNLEKITFEEGSRLKELRRGCFRYCKIRDITISENLKTIEEDNFEGCRYLTDIKVDEKNTHFKAEDGVLYSYDGKKLIKYPPGLEKERFVAPDGVSVIVKSAFTLGMNTVKHIDVSSVDYVERLAFYSIIAETITFSSKTKMEDRPFGRSKLKTVILPEGTSEIGIYEFCDTYIDYIIIPHSVKTIERQAFDFFMIMPDKPENEQVHIKYIYYCGNEKDWLKTGYRCNMGEASPTVCFYSENKPAASGNFWHYDSDGKTPILWAA